MSSRESTEESIQSVNKELGPSSGNDSLDSLPRKTVTYSGDNNEFVIIDNKKYHRHELMQAFGGTFNPGLAPPPTRSFGNPAVLGLAGFSLPTFILGLFNAQVKGIEIPNLIISLCFFYGGVTQALAGVWEMFIGNTFAATTFLSYSGFWFSYGAILTPAFGILDAYAAAPEQTYQAIGLYLLGWTVLTFMFFLLTLKSTVAFIGLFITLLLSFSLSTAGYLTGNFYLVKVSGGFSIACSIFGWYLAWAGAVNPQNSYFTYYALQIPTVSFGGKKNKA
ncbi:GPR1/FUN34/yaaH family-domain-containing protein [Scheffersomyces coipomensis]|uniref:GPR1/FUN34/yaaH family-domain-containing protein n=1 Tax=Scheffersomyces coipomensis TaxID=1788519 RepID=UPI00315C763F